MIIPEPDEYCDYADDIVCYIALGERLYELCLEEDDLWFWYYCFNMDGMPTQDDEDILDQICAMLNVQDSTAGLGIVEYLQALGFDAIAT
jgi:hypothetical protein